MVTELQELETPALLVDLDRMEANLDRAASYAERHGLSLRPHIKTHKSPLLAGEQLRRGAGGLTCATPFEAEVMSAVCDDILVMYPPVGEPRADRLARLAERVQLTVALDSDTAARDLARATAKAGTRARVLIEIDAGMHRVGVQSSAEAVVLARQVDVHKSLDVVGVAFYPGHVRGPVSEHGAHLAALSRLVHEVRADFELARLPITVVSAGSTPTLWQTHLVDGVTEMRPGTYIFNDRTTAEIGACEPADCALTVLASVVSTAVAGQAVIDAGSKALGREPIRGVAGEGFGCVWNEPEAIVKSMSEEHGILDLSRTAWRPKVGDRVHIVPNHVCIVVHLADIVYGIRGDAVVSSWPVAARGRGLQKLPNGTNLTNSLANAVSR